MALNIHQSTDILNEALTKAGYEFQIRNDDTKTSERDADYNSIKSFGVDGLNKLLNQANQILIYRNYKLMFSPDDNKTRILWRDFIHFGGGVEDIFHEIIQANEGYANGDIWAEDSVDVDSDTFGAKVATNMCKYYGSDVAKSFHTKQGSFTIPLSITDLEISKVFTPEGFNSYVNVKMSNLQSSAEYKLLLIAIAQVKKMVDDGALVFDENHDLTSLQGIMNFAERIGTVTDGMKTPVSVFNKGKAVWNENTNQITFQPVITKSEDSDLYLITTPELVNRVKVQGYSNAYNFEQMKINNKLIELPYGTDLGSYNGKKVIGVLIDKRAIVLALRYWAVKTFPLPNTDYQNYFLKAQYIKGYNTFFNAVAFVGSEDSN